MKQIRMRNFKSFGREESLCLSPRTNIVVGRNGAGKSSLVAAIGFLMGGEKLSSEERAELIHEGGHVLEETASVEVVFHSDREPGGGRDVSVKRIIGARRDEYIVDGRVVCREEVVGLFEGAGFRVDNPYFIVEQGKVTELAVVSSEGRYELMKNAAGVSRYEKDRERSMGMISSTEQNEKRILHGMSRIEERLRGLEREKKEAERYEELSREKKRLEYGWISREIGAMNRDLVEIEKGIPGDRDECSSESEEDGMERMDEEMEELVRERKRLVVDERYSGKETGIMEEIRKIGDSMRELRDRRDREKEELERFRISEREVFVRSNYLKHLVRFVDTVERERVSLEEIRSSRDVLERKKRELETCGDGDRETRGDGRNSMSLEMLVERRKFLWREERRLESSIKSMEETIVGQGQKLVEGDGYEQVGSGEGVIGYVYELVSMADELVDAFEAVAGGSLFNIVVEDEEVASRVLLGGGGRCMSRITLMPLNRIECREEEEIKDASIIPLTSQVKCDDRYRAAVRYITRNFYLCSDLRSAMEVSRRYSINVVTLDGDVVNRTGPISGGYERKRSFFREYRKTKEEIGKRRLELCGVLEELRRVNEDIEGIKVMSRELGEVRESRYRESLRAAVMFLEEKVRILEGIRTGRWEGMKTGKLREEERDLEYKERYLQGEIRKGEARVEEMGLDVRKLVCKQEKLGRELEMAQMWSRRVEIDRRIEELRERERKAREGLGNEENRELFRRPRKMDLEVEKLIARKHMLIRRRSELCERIGVSDFRGLEDVYPEKSKEEMMEELARVNEKMKRHPQASRGVISQWEGYAEQKRSLESRLDELRRNKEEIVRFVLELDRKKEEAVDQTFSRIKEDFCGFYSRLAVGGTASLGRDGEGVDIRIDGETINMNGLSGGQKTIVALSLILSIQRVSPSPFHVFDEMDANLDIQSRERVARLIREMSSEDMGQFLITTFKKEMVGCGNRFFGVDFVEKTSSIREMDKDTAYEFLNDDEVER